MQHVLYTVPHSAEGWESYLRQGHRPGELASWSFSNCQDGDFYQHYPLEAITWTSGTMQANISGLAVENEGIKGQPLNARQVANLRRLQADVDALCPNLRAPIYGQGFREHWELSANATTCPNGRIQPLYDSYVVAPPPPPAPIIKEQDLYIQFEGNGTVYWTNGIRVEAIYDSALVPALPKFLAKNDPLYAKYAKLSTVFAGGNPLA